MDYASFRSFRDALCAERSPLRLDCMNPTQALSRWPVLERRRARDAALTPAPAPVSIDHVLEAWRRLTGEPEGGSAGRWLLGRGVRDLLGALLPSLLTDAEELWLPDDVYPVYWQLAGATAIASGRARPFPTCALTGMAEWSFRESDARRAVVLCPIPLSPLGRMVDAAEIGELVRWLGRSPERTVLVDAVYAYDLPALSAALAPLRATGQCVVLHSLAKSHLAQGALGLAWLPPSLAARIPSDALATSRPDPATALHALTAIPELPALQQAAFTREWSRLAPAIRAAWPDWRAPETGYFSIVPRPFDALLAEHDLLAVPASVFGAPRNDHSVITCLHDLVEHERAAPSDEP